MCPCIYGQSLQSCLSVTLWTVAHQVPLSVGFSRQEYCSGLPCPPPGVLPNPGKDPHLLHPLHWQADSLHTCMYKYTYFFIFFPLSIKIFNGIYELYIDCSSQQVKPCDLPCLYVVVCVSSSQTPNLPLPSPSPFGNQKFVFSVCESVSIL